MFARFAAATERYFFRTLPRAAFQSKPILSRRPQSILHPLRQQRFASRYERFPGKRGSETGSEWMRFGPFARANYIIRSYPKSILVIVTASGTIYVINLEQVPVTGRWRFNVLSPETEKSMAGDYNEILKEYRGKILPENHPYTQLVAKVVERLLPSTGGLAGDEWRVFVIDEPKEKNAFVVPGGKVFVFSGLLPIAQDEAGLAAVLGHEIAHNVAHHAAERISGSLVWTIVAVIGSLILGIDANYSNSLTQLALALPNSRTQEAEADRIGLFMMAQSCYDPKAAIGLWERMRQAEKGAPPQFLSTHPSSSSRIKSIEGWLPQAQQKYDDNECGMIGRYVQDFRLKTGKGIESTSTNSSKPQVDDDFF